MAARTLGTLTFSFGLVLAGSGFAHAADEASDAPQPKDDESSEATPEDAPPQAESENKTAVTLSTEGSKDGTDANEGDAPAPAQPTRASGQGFFLRSTLGGGHSWAFARATDAQPDVAMQTLGGNLMLNPGYQFTPQLAVHADLYGAMLFAHKTNSESNTDDYSAKGLGLVTATVGLGATYQTAPSDLYISAGAGLSEAWGSRFLFAGEVGRTAVITEPEFTNPGYAAHGSVGKMIDMHQRWALGASLNYNFQTFGTRSESILTFQRVHSVWLGFTTTFHPVND